MKKNNQKLGLAFEKAVYAFVNTLDAKAAVLFDHKVPDRDTGTPRQCDVWINAKIGGHLPLSILVSCKDHKKKLDVGNIGTFRDEIQSTGASTGVIYSKSGFTKPAIEKAKSSGIACCRLYENEPADIPNIFNFESYVFTPQVAIALVDKIDDPTIKTWGDLFNLTESGTPIVELIESAYLDAEKKSIEESWQIGKPYSWELTLRIFPDNWTSELKVKVIGNWRKYRGKIEATLFNGSYSITNNSFKGTISGPLIDTKGSHPGDDWIEILDEKFEMPKDRILAILYSGHVKNALIASLENQLLYQTSKSPEQQELEIKKENLIEIEEQLSQLELEFNTLQAVLQNFQSRYTDLIVTRMYELDKIEAKIAEHLVSTDENNPEYRQRLNKLKGQLVEAEEAFKKEKNISSKNEFKPSDSLKNLYRDIAKKVHPDLVIDEKERERRTEIMAKLNEAYQNGDEQKLEQILNEWQYDPENVPGEDIGSQLVKVIRKIAQVQKRISMIEEGVRILKNTEIYNLMEKSKESTKDGIDLLIQMSGYLDVQIHGRKQYLEFLQSGGNQ